MHLVPKNADQIERLLSNWRWRNDATGTLVGVSIGLVLAAMTGVKLAVWPISVLGGIVGLLLVRRHWRGVIARYGDSFIHLDESVLEIRALVRGGIRTGKGVSPSKPHS